MELIIEKQRLLFNSNTTKDIDFRISQLKKLRELIESYESQLNAAIYNDFRKSAFDTYSCETAILYAEIDDAIRHVKQWSKIQKVKTNLLNFPARSYIVPEPLGVSLVIGAWNYPYQLSLAPAIAAIAAGNTVVLKPSELPAETSRIMAKLVNDNFDPAFFVVVEGGITETEQLLQQRFDKIFFTGSVNVGRIVYQAAAKHLTPITLELGGKSPALILDDCNLDMCVKRLVWAKYLNAGQTCIAPDYVLVSEKLKDKFIETVIREIKKEQFSIENQNYVQIINDKNVQRLSKMIDANKVVYGGSVDERNRVIEPTVMSNVSFADAVMEEEIFGPILPVITYKSVDESIAEIKKREKPLACYVFTESKSLRNKILREVSFGGGAVNETIMHISNSHMPFGGVGQSGIGSYHGKYGFQTFSHFKSILDKPNWFEANVKYFPHSLQKIKLMKLMFKFN